MPRMRGRLYSSCASSTWSLPSDAPRVLREDVEDQLRAVDDARAELVLERALLRRAELVVGEQDLRRRAGVRRLELAELALPDERPRIGAAAMLDDLSDGSSTRRACELTELLELVVAVRALRIHADEERALRLRPGCGIGLARSHRGIMPRYAPAVTALADRLAARTLELVDIPSQSGSEAAIREHLLELVPRAWRPSSQATRRSCSRRSGGPERPLIVLAAHYDTVPAQDNLPGRIADGDGARARCERHEGRARGRARARARPRSPPRRSCDVALLLFGREELPAEHNPLPALFDGSTLVHEATLAVVLEPTDLAIQAGCLGNVVARLTFHGTSGHAARPWLADSALERAVRGLAPLFELEPRTAVVNGLEFREVVSVTRLDAGIADNVIPGEAVATLNLRYPPDREPADAEAYPRRARAGRRDARDREQRAAGARRRLAGRARAPASRGPRRSVRSRRGRTSPTSRRAGSTPSTSAPVTPRSHTIPTSTSSIDALVTAYEVLRRFLTSPIGEDGAVMDLAQRIDELWEADELDGAGRRGGDRGARPRRRARGRAGRATAGSSTSG